MCFESFAMILKRPFMAYTWFLSCCRSDDEDEDDGGGGDDDNNGDEGGQEVCEQHKQPTLRASKYVKQVGRF
jgi:hypothetical protein